MVEKNNFMAAQQWLFLFRPYTYKGSSSSGGGGSLIIAIIILLKLLWQAGIIQCLLIGLGITTAIGTVYALITGAVFTNNPVAWSITMGLCFLISFILWRKKVSVIIRTMAALAVLGVFSVLLVQFGVIDGGSDTPGEIRIAMTARPTIRAELEKGKILESSNKSKTIKEGEPLKIKRKIVDGYTLVEWKNNSTWIKTEDINIMEVTENTFGIVTSDSTAMMFLKKVSLFP